MTITYRAHVYTVHTEPELLQLIDTLQAQDAARRLDYMAVCLLVAFGLVALLAIVWSLLP